MQCSVCYEDRSFAEFMYPVCRHPLCLLCAERLHQFNPAALCPICRQPLEDESMRFMRTMQELTDEHLTTINRARAENDGLRAEVQRLTAELERAHQRMRTLDASLARFTQDQNRAWQASGNHDGAAHASTTIDTQPPPPPPLPPVHFGFIPPPPSASMPPPPVLGDRHRRLAEVQPYQPQWILRLRSQRRQREENLRRQEMYARDQ